MYTQNILVYRHNPPPRKLYYAAFMMSGYAIGYYMAQAIHDEDVKYFASVRFPMPMRHFEITVAYIGSLLLAFKLYFVAISSRDRMGITNETELHGEAGKYNIY